MEGTTEIWRMVSVLMPTIDLGGKRYLPEANNEYRSPCYIALTTKLGVMEGMGQKGSEDRGP